MTTLFPAAALALAGHMTPPLPADRVEWMADGDYPPSALRIAERGYFIANISVSPEGRPSYCEPVKPSPLSRAACAMLMKKARFTPATDAAGRPSFGVYTHRILFKLPATTLPAAPEKIAMRLTVNALPETAPNPATIHLALLVDEKGKPSGCRPWLTRQMSEKAEKELGAIACGQIVDGYGAPIARDAGGRPVVSVQSAVVRFDTAQTPSGG